ncbi:hypothetical protein [Desertibaculum subflavum]|uniref:hypothetical protein n=1 Tax=Desertibaculum subflavum TaxID=2268458 RepID=UPI000E672C03
MFGNRGAKEEQEFRNWLRSHPPRAGSLDVSLSAWRKLHQVSGQEDTAHFAAFTAWIEAMPKEDLASARLQVPAQLPTLHGRGMKDHFVAELKISCPGRSVALTGWGAGIVDANNCRYVHIKDMFVGRLVLHAINEILIENCWIGRLQIGSKVVGDCIMKGGGILSIQCPPPKPDSPFTGAVHFSPETRFPEKKTDEMQDAQAYRNLRAHMIALENNPMANKFYVLEQRFERDREHENFAKAVSWLYAGLSSYGSSMLRPLLWFGGLYAATFLLLLVTDGVALAEDRFGWQAGLSGSDYWAQARRAFFLTNQSTFNPLGIFGAKSIAAAANGWLAFWLVIHGLLSAIFATLFILAVRRRFKIAS